MADKVITSSGPCDCCGGGGSSCLLVIPPYTTPTPYATEAAALAVLADSSYVASCLVYAAHNSSAFTGLSATGGSSIQIDLTGFSDPTPYENNSGEVWCAAELSAGDLISAVCDGGSFIALFLYKPDGTLYGTFYGGSGSVDATFEGETLPESGCWTICVTGTTAGTSMQFDITSSGVLVSGGLKAAWDDGGGVNYIICT